MTKHEFIEAFAEKSNFTKKDSEFAVNTFMECISDALQNGEKVVLVGFGSFEVRNRKATTAINLQTGKKIKIPAKKVPAFKAGKTLKEAVKR